MGIISSWSYAAGGILIQNKSTGPLRIVIPLSGGGYLDVNGTTSLWGDWNHIAVERSSGTLNIVFPVSVVMFIFSLFNSLFSIG